MGGTEFPAVPALVDRGPEMDRIRLALEAAGRAEATLLLIRGEAGSGKTRLIHEAAAEGANRGRAVVFGAARAESPVPYHLWTEPLERLGLGGTLREAPPPRLLALWLLAPEGRPLVKAERSADGGSGLVHDQTGLVPIAAEHGNQELLSGELSATAHGDGRVIVLERREFRLAAEVEGHEDEGFLVTLRALADALRLGAPEANRAAEQSFREVLDSGRYDGIDHARSDPKLRQSRLFQNVALGVIRQAELHPLLMVFDDLQWADPSSLALLQYVARNVRHSNALLLGSYRVEDGVVRPHLRDALGQMDQEGLLAEINLEGLSRQDLGFLAGSFIGPHALPEPFLDLLWHETRGNPLLVREVLRGLEEAKAIQTEGAMKQLLLPVGELSLPLRVREAIRARLGRVPRTDRRLLEAAATCGTRFTTAMVARLVGESEGKVLNGFGTIAGTYGFLRKGASGFAFDHPAMQEVLYDEMAEDVRRVYHRQAGEWLELAGGPAEDVAEHYYRARDPRATERLWVAAEAARQRYSNAEAIRFCSAALELEQDAANKVRLLETLGALDDLIGNFGEALVCYHRALELSNTKDRKAEILAKVGRTLEMKGDYEESVKVSSAASALVTDEGTALEALVLNNLGLVHSARGEYEQALQSYRKSLEISTKISDQVGIANSLSKLANVHGSRGDYEQALDSLRKCREISEKIGDQRGIANSLSNLGNVHWSRGDFEQALDSYRKSLEIWERIGDQRGIAVSLGHIGMVQWARGDYEPTLGSYRKSLEILERIGDQRGIAVLLTNLGNVHWARGEYEKALDSLRKGLEISDKIGNQVGIANSLGILGLVHSARGEYEQALESHRTALQISERIGDQLGIADAWVALGQLHAERGDLSMASESAQQGLQVADRIGYRQGKLDAQLVVSEIRLRKGDLAEARSFGNLVFSESRSAGLKSQVVDSQRILGMVAREGRDWVESTEHFEESLRTAEQLGNPLLEGRTLYEFGIMWKQKGDNDKAMELLSAAAGIFKRIKTPKWLERAQEALRDLGG